MSGIQQRQGVNLAIECVFPISGSAAIASDKGLSKRAKHHEESLPVQDYLSFCIIQEKAAE
jgi:hypothetical protein